MGTAGAESATPKRTLCPATRDVSCNTTGTIHLGTLIFDNELGIFLGLRVTNTIRLLLFGEEADLFSARKSHHERTLLESDSLLKPLA